MNYEIHMSNGMQSVVWYVNGIFLFIIQFACRLFDVRRNVFSGPGFVTVEPLVYTLMFLCNVIFIYLFIYVMYFGVVVHLMYCLQSRHRYLLLLSVYSKTLL